MSSQAPLNKLFNIDWQNWKKPIVYALLASLVLHGVLLAFKWHAESEQERRLKTPLSVVLVNASSPTAPLNPKKLAQVNLNGGGELTEGQASALRRADPKLAEQLEKIQADQKRLLSQMLGEKINPVPCKVKVLWPHQKQIHLKQSWQNVCKNKVSNQGVQR
jgi:protein TonB